MHFLGVFFHCGGRQGWDAGRQRGGGSSREKGELRSAQGRPISQRSIPIPIPPLLCVENRRKLTEARKLARISF